MSAMNTALTMNPIPTVSTTTVSLRIAARIKKVTRAPHMNRTKSIAGILSVIPAMIARNVGTNETNKSARPIHPIDSAVLGRSLCSRKCLIELFILENRFNQSVFVEDVLSDFGDSLFFPSWVDVVCMIV